MDRVAGPQLFHNCASQVKPVNKTDGGKAIGVKVGPKVGSRADWVWIAPGSGVARLLEADAVIVAAAFSFSVEGTKIASLGGFIQYLIEVYAARE